MMHCRHFGIRHLLACWFLTSIDAVSGPGLWQPSLRSNGQISHFCQGAHRANPSLFCFMGSAQMLNEAMLLICS